MVALTDWDTSLVEAMPMIRSAARDLLNHVSKVPGLTPDDLAQEGMIAAFESRDDYDPSFGTKPTTFMRMAAFRRMQTVHRGDFRHLVRVLKCEPVDQVRDAAVEIELAEDAPAASSLDLLESTFSHFRAAGAHVLGLYQRHGLTSAQCAAIFALKGRMSQRQAAGWLAGTPGKLIGLKSAPSRRKIQRIWRTQDGCQMSQIVANGRISHPNAAFRYKLIQSGLVG